MSGFVGVCVHVQMNHVIDKRQSARERARDTPNIDGNNVYNGDDHDLTNSLVIDPSIFVCLPPTTCHRTTTTTTTN